MEQIFKSPHLWLLFIFATCANAVCFRVRAREHAREHPELADGYAALIRGWLLWGSLPWLVMAAGLEFGHVPNIWHYFRPRGGNPFVLAWYACVVVLWILGLYWVFRRGGAEMLADHSRIFRGDLSSPGKVKLVCLLCVAAGVAAFLFLLLMDVPPLFGNG
ncbi:MAG TPA: hypothetical protein VLZ30_09875 [Verrucomicrobiae bacterium]|nr:hypothetical protein [Verrucomicrobiae bacterium]